MIGIIMYIGTYGIYVSKLNKIGLETGFKRKGAWQKSIIFPYWDNWSGTHLIWGGFGALLNLTTSTMVVLSILNEFYYEPNRCAKYKKGDTSISYAQHCDSKGHKIADTLYTLLGYGIVKTLKTFK